MVDFATACLTAGGYSYPFFGVATPAHCVSLHGILLPEKSCPRRRTVRLFSGPAEAPMFEIFVMDLLENRMGSSISKAMFTNMVNPRLCRPSQVFSEMRRNSFRRCLMLDILGLPDPVGHSESVIYRMVAQKESDEAEFGGWLNDSWYPIIYIYIWLEFHIKIPSDSIQFQ